MSKHSAMDQVRGVAPAPADAFKTLRAALVNAGPLDRHTVELIVLGGLVTTGGARSFRTHALRLLDDGMDPSALQHAVLVTLGASSTLDQVATALAWIDDLVSDRGSRRGGGS